MDAFFKRYEHAGGKRRGINSVEQGVAVLEAVVELGATASLKDIARVAGMDPSQTHRYVSSLVNSGMLRQDKTSGVYDLGPTALRAGLAALARLDPIAQVDDAARALSRRSGGTVLVSVWAVSGATIIRWHHGTPPVYTMLTVGSALPLTSATGKIFAAFLADPLIAPLVERDGLAGPAFEAERATICAAHFATIDNKVIPGLRAMAGPVLGAGDQVIATLTMIASDATPTSADAVWKKDLQEACRALTLDLGGNWNAPA